ncbi:hypothetical protein GQ457_02G026750 [Hibiscus cannabinus]
MLMLYNGEIESDLGENEPTLPREDEDDDVELAANSEILVVKRSINAQPSQDDQQRKNIFHTRYHVNDKVCIVIIDDGSCTNAANTLMVDKLGLKTTKHPKSL